MGDYNNLIFDWNFNDEAKEREMKQVQQGAVMLTKSDPEAPSWAQFNANLSRIKYKAKHETRVWKKQEVKKKIEWFKDAKDE